MRVSSGLALALASLACVGCLGPAEEPVESGSASVTLGQAWIDAQATPQGWPSDDFGTVLLDSVRGTTTASDGYLHTVWLPDGTPRTTYRKMVARGPSHAFAASASGPLELRATSHRLWDNWQTVQLTELGLIVYHRPAGSRHAWVPLRCGSYLEGYAPANAHEIGYFESWVSIDSDARRIATKTVAAVERGTIPIIGNREQHVTLGFEACGISEATPEFAALVLPVRVRLGYEFWWSYDYILTARCGVSDCPPYEAPDRANAQEWGPAEATWIGVEVEPLGEAGEAMGVPYGHGAPRITRVYSSSPASRAGLLHGDILTSVDGQPIAADDLASRIRSLGAGKTVPLQVLRPATSGQPASLTFPVTIESNADRVTPRAPPR